MGYHLCCGHPNYFTSTLDIVKWSHSGQGAVYQIPLMDLLKVNNIYLPLFLVVFMYVLSKQEKKPDHLLSACTYYLVAVITFEVWYRVAIPSALLEMFYYFSFFLVSCIGCLALVPIMLARAGNSEARLLNLALATFLLPPLLIVYVYPVSMDHVPAYWVVLSFAFTLLLFLLTIKFKQVTPFVIVLFVLSTQVSLLSTVNLGVPFYAQMYNASGDVNLSKYRLGLKFIETMPKFKEEGRPIYFWYSNADKLANSLQSTYLWGYSRFFDSAKETKGLPSLKGANVELLQKQEKSSLVLFDRDKRNVNQGIEELRRVGLSFSIKKTQEICEQPICYTIVVLDVNGSLPLNTKQDWNEGKGRRLGIVLDWRHAEAGTSVEWDGAIVSVVTPPKAWNYGAVAPMVFSEQPPAEHGVIRILVSVREGRAGLGFTGRNISNFIKRVEVLPKNEPQELFFEIDNLGELHNFVIQTSDRDKSARVRVLELELALQHRTGR